MLVKRKDTEEYYALKRVNKAKLESDKEKRLMADEIEFLENTRSTYLSHMAHYFEVGILYSDIRVFHSLECKETLHIHGACHWR